jgi:hypothetical protein
MWWRLTRFISTLDLSHNFEQQTLHLSFEFNEIEFESGCHYSRHHSISPHSVSHAINKEKGQHGVAVGTRQGTFLLVKGLPFAANRPKPARSQKLAKNQYDGETSTTHGMMSAAMMDDMIDDDDEDDEEDDEEDDGESGNDDEQEDQDMQSLDEDDASLEGEEQATSAFQDLEEDNEDDTKVSRPKKNDKALFRPPTAEEMEMLKREGEDRGSSFGFSMKVRRHHLCPSPGPSMLTLISILDRLPNS